MCSDICDYVFTHISTTCMWVYVSDIVNALCFICSYFHTPPPQCLIQEELQSSKSFFCPNLLYDPINHVPLYAVNVVTPTTLVIFTLSNDSLIGLWLLHFQKTLISLPRTIIWIFPRHGKNVIINVHVHPVTESTFSLTDIRWQWSPFSVAYTTNPHQI